MSPAKSIQTHCSRVLLYLLATSNFEGERRAAVDNNLIADHVMPYGASHATEVMADLSFAVDANGILHVSVREFGFGWYEQ